MIRRSTDAEIPTFVTHLECGLTGAHQPADQLANLSEAGKPLIVRYDLGKLGASLSKDDLLPRAPDMWRYREFLPIRRSENVISLGECITPLVPTPRAAKRLGGAEILIKEEGRLPTGSFKARGLAVAVSMAKELGVTRIAMPTAGNAGAALAAYATRAGIEAYVFCPDDAPDVTVNETALLGGKVWRVNGIITDLGPLVEAGRSAMKWFNMSTLKEPYRVEGKKTMGLELAEQLGWDVPDAILYPTGGGTGLIGMWKAFDELERIGWIGPKRPRMIAVQSTTCAPIVRAMQGNGQFAEPWEGGHTSVPGMRVPFTIGDFLILRVLRESNGFGIAVPDEAVEPARAEMGSIEGIHLCPEGAATYAAYKMALADGRLSRNDRVVLFNCATGLKYPMPEVTRSLDRLKPIDFAKLA
ncbi:MAG: threonine synthase [Proteobacteria bacterium]|nr:threonine synthase [Pseudomonadota bacterium]